MPKFIIEGQEITCAVYTVEAETPMDAMEKLDTCLNGRDWYPAEGGKRVSCDPKDYTREDRGTIPVPDTWCVVDEDGEFVL